MQRGSDRIVAGVDGSPCSLHALQWAVHEAARSAAELEVIHVWPGSWSTDGGPTLSGAGKDGRTKMRAQLARWVADALSGEGSPPAKISERLLTGEPAPALVEHSRTARMLVLGTTGLTGVRRRILGSVSQRCAQLSPVPVVIVPLPGSVVGDAPGYVEAASAGSGAAASSPIHH